MKPAPQQFTAAQIARAASAHSETRISRQGVAKLLLDAPATGMRATRGGAETSTWSFAVLPDSLKRRLETASRLLKYRNAETLLESLVAQQPSPLARPASLDKIADSELAKAGKLRDVLAPFLRDQSQPAAERNALIAARYGDAFGVVIGTEHARKLYQRTLDRDAGIGDYGRPALYLPENPRRKAVETWNQDASNIADLLPSLESRLASITSPADPPKAIVRAVWHVACEEYTHLVAGEVPGDRAARMVRDFLHARAPFLPRNRDTLLKAWNEKLARFLAREGRPGALMDLRSNNGKNICIPDSDVALLRWSAMTKHSGRLDAAWREEYAKLSETTRINYPRSWRVPRTITKAVNREILNGLTARRQGRRYLEKLLGQVLCNVEGIPSMHGWVMDDLTCTLEVFVRNGDGTTSLCLVQFIAVMDIRSRKIVGWAASLDAGPTAELVCEAFLDAVRRTGKVPHHLFLENGWVFGRSNNVVGKQNESGEVMIAGLAEYGCEVHHFTPGNPTSKGELEKAFDMLQRSMERHPGYTSRNQRLAAPDQFRREQIEMRRKTSPRDPATCRYDFQQGVRAIERIVIDYNGTPNHGDALNGLSPDQGFTAFEDRDNPPISLPAKLHWMLAYRYRVTVKVGGVRFSHFGFEFRLRGGMLAGHIGEEFWAVVDSREADCVTFMSLDFAIVFTESLRPRVDKDESETNPESGALKRECETKAEHRRVIQDQYHGLLNRFGDPRANLLRQAQEESRNEAVLSGAFDLAPDARIPVVDANFAAASVEGKRQRGELRRRARVTENKASLTNVGKRIAEDEGIELTNDMAARPGINDALKSILGNEKESE